MTNPTTLEQLLGLDNEDDGGTDSGNEDTGKGLRAQLKAVLAREKAASTELALLKARDRERTAADLVTKYDIPLLARDLLLKETEGDLTDEAVTAFATKYGELWGRKTAEASTTPEQQTATAAVQALSATGTELPLELKDEAAYRAQYAEASTKEDVMRMVAEATGGLTLRE